MGNPYWIPDSSLTYWPDEILSRAANRFHGSGASDDWVYTPLYTRYYWKQNALERGSILFEKLISKYKPFINRPDVAIRHLIKYYGWHSSYARLLERNGKSDVAYEFLDAFAQNAEQNAMDDSAKYSQEWNLIAGKLRLQLFNLSITRNRQDDALYQIEFNFRLRPDLKKISYEHLKTYGMSSLTILLGKYPDGINNIKVRNYLENIRRITSSENVQSASLLTLARYAEGKLEYQKADSLYIETIKQYPNASERFWEGRVNWSHTALKGWIYGPISRDGDYEEANRRASGEILKFSPGLEQAAIILRCGILAFEGKTKNEEWDECLKITELKRSELNYHPASPKALTQTSGNIGDWLRRNFSYKSKKRNQRVGMGVTSLAGQRIFQYPYSDSDYNTTGQDTARVLLTSTGRVLPISWTKIILSDSVEVWVDSNKIRVIRLN